MSIENEIVGLVLERIVSALRGGISAKSAKDAVYFFVDVVMEFKDGKVLLRSGYGENRVATVLNGGIFEGGESVVVIRTANGELWAYFPFGVGTIIRQKLFTLRDTYILSFIDDSGSMAADIPAIETMLAQFRETINKTIYGGSEAKISQYFPPTQKMQDERFVRWMASPPADGSTGRYAIVTLNFINESHNVYGETKRWVPDTAMTPEFLEDVALLKEESKLRSMQRHMVFNVLRAPDWNYGAFLLDAADYLKDYYFQPLDVPPDKPADYYIELVDKAVREWQSE